jgi:hypothetical protein
MKIFEYILLLYMLAKFKLNTLRMSVAHTEMYLMIDSYNSIFREGG